MSEKLPNPDDFMTADEFCARMRISKDTFYKWRQIPGAAPVVHKMRKWGAAHLRRRLRRAAARPSE